MSSDSIADTLVAFGCGCDGIHRQNYLVSPRGVTEQMLEGEALNA